MVIRSKHQKRCRDEQAENDAFVRMVHGVKRVTEYSKSGTTAFPSLERAGKKFSERTPNVKASQTYR
ncbi:hypothetical protein MUO83_02875 [Candidatus Bathyarchaeota archaeon]|nr:hypothetical protein [Candidatus Bathyarchaeota archaeon]